MEVKSTLNIFLLERGLSALDMFWKTSRKLPRLCSQCLSHNFVYLF
jgi:hypothetical protein